MFNIFNIRTDSSCLAGPFETEDTLADIMILTRCPLQHCEDACFKEKYRIRPGGQRNPVSKNNNNNNKNTQKNPKKS